jgi:hypothetical protein
VPQHQLSPLRRPPAELVSARADAYPVTVRPYLSYLWAPIPLRRGGTGTNLEN